MFYLIVFVPMKLTLAVAIFLSQGDTIRVIFSFTDTDPEDITGLDYHGSSNRGTKSVLLLTYNPNDQTLPDDTISWEILVSEVTFCYNSANGIRQEKCHRTEFKVNFTL